MQEAFEFPFSQTMQFQKSAMQLFLNGLEMQEAVQRRGLAFTRQAMDNYFGTMEETASDVSEGAAAVGRGVVRAQQTQAEFASPQQQYPQRQPPQQAQTQRQYPQQQPTSTAAQQSAPAPQYTQQPAPTYGQPEQYSQQPYQPTQQTQPTQQPYQPTQQTQPTQQETFGGQEQQPSQQQEMYGSYQVPVGGDEPPVPSQTQQADTRRSSTEPTTPRGGAPVDEGVEPPSQYDYEGRESTSQYE
jgi:hypothetical protein